jgi:dinuclear metal center YbgI/SA1388 family protein
MKLSTIIGALEESVPLDLQESYDNAGLILGDPDMDIRGALISIDTTENIIEEAIEQGCNLVLSHHPVIFKGIKKITGETYVERTILKAIRHDIAIYAIHTNLDNILFNGVNGKIAEKLGLVDLSVLSEKSYSDSDSFGNQHFGAGVVGYLEQPISETDFLTTLKNAMDLTVIRYTSLLNKPIHKIAVCGGAGSFLLPRAIEQKADIYISADFKYHEFFDADNKIIIADIGHFESEQYTMELLHDIMTEKFPNFAARYAKTITNPIKYFI